MKCIEACPKGAIAIANASAAVDAHACTKCGICVGVCDGFAIPGASVEAVFSQMRKIALTGEKVVLTCSYLLPSSFTPADNVIVLPCLAMLPPELWTCALALGIDLAVAVIFEECEACKRTNSQGLERFSCAIEQAEDVTECTVAIIDDVPEAQVAPTLMQTLGDASGKDRREALLDLKDQAEDIAEIVLFLDGRPSEHNGLLQQMARAAITMVTNSVDAFVKRDTHLATQVVRSDDTVDRYFSDIKQSLITKISENPADGAYFLDCLMIAKYFERIADHAVNIAQWVISR